MKGYSFRSLTDLVLKIFKTKVNAGTGLSGGGSLEADRTLAVKYGTAAGTATQGNDTRVVNAASNATVNAKEAALEAKKADKAITITAGTGLSGGGTLAANRTLNVSYGTAAGTAAQGNDSRLSNSREWTAATIGQAETEAGTATTRRAFTAQRVRQAIVAWFNGISGALGRTILTRTTAAQVRSDIGLGTAATRNVGEGSGQLMQVGAFGLGNSQGSWTEQQLNSGIVSQFFSSASNSVSPYSVGATLGYHSGSQATQIFSRQFRLDPVISVRNFTDNQWGQPVTLHHTGNLLQTTGTSTEYPMSQGAVTSQLATKVSTSTQVIAGTGLTGGGSLSANRTLNVSYGTSAGSAAQGNDSRIVNAVPNSRTVTAGTGLTGGGNLSSNRTLSIATSHTPIGVGQTWQDVTGSREAGTTYTNTTGRTIVIAPTTIDNRKGGGVGGQVYVNGVLVSELNGISSHNEYKGIVSYNTIIPPNATYRFDLLHFDLLHRWLELR